MVLPTGEGISPSLPLLLAFTLNLNPASGISSLQVLPNADHLFVHFD